MDVALKATLQNLPARGLRVFQRSSGTDFILQGRLTVLTTVIVTQDTFKRLWKAEVPFMSGEWQRAWKKRGEYFAGISEKTKEYKRALQKKKKRKEKKKSTVLCVPPALTAQFLATLSPISFYFSGVYNVISAEGLTRSLRFVGSAGKMQNDRLSNNRALSTFYSNFLLVLLRIVFLRR